VRNLRVSKRYRKHVMEYKKEKQKWKIKNLPGKEGNHRKLDNEKTIRL